MIYIVIPARGGSVGVPHKNILEVDGTPLLIHALRVAQALPLSNKEIVLSTDSESYLQLAVEAGYSHHNLRPAHLSTSKAHVVDAVLYELATFSPAADDMVLLLEPSFFPRDDQNIVRAISLVSENMYDSIFGAARVPGKFHYQKQYRVTDGLAEQVAGLPNINRQQLEVTYNRSGEFYLSRYDFVEMSHSFFGGRLGILETCGSHVNIDDATDVERLWAIVDAHVQTQK